MKRIVIFSILIGSALSCRKSNSNDPLSGTRWQQVGNNCIKLSFSNDSVTQSATSCGGGSGTFHYQRLQNDTIIFQSNKVKATISGDSLFFAGGTPPNDYIQKWVKY